jgi:hypothetical protein
VLLSGATPGLVAYLAAGQVHVLDITSGVERYSATASAAQLTDAGLFYSYQGAPPWPGRIRYLPIAQLRAGAVLVKR